MDRMTMNGAKGTGAKRPDSPGSVTLAQRRKAMAGSPDTPDVRLYHRAVVVAQVRELTLGLSGCWV